MSLAQNGLGFWSTAFAGLISAIGAAVVLSLFGYWHVLWSWVLTAVVVLWRWLSFAVAIPLGIILIIGVIIIWAFLRWWLHQPKSVVNITSLSQSSIQPTVGNLADNELLVIRMLARADGQWLGMEQIAAQMQKSMLVTEQTLEQLLRKNLIVDRKNYIYGPTFRLSSFGRDYSIQEGFAL